MDKGNRELPAEITGKLISPFRWLFAKRRRWIPVLAIIMATILVYITVLCIDWISYKNSERQYRLGEEQYINALQQVVVQLKSDLEQNKDLWQANNYSDYSFKLEKVYGLEILIIITDGGFPEPDSEYVTGRHMGDSIRETPVIIEVRDGIPVSVTDSSTGNPAPEADYEYCNTIAKLFTVIDDILYSQGDSAVKIRGDAIRQEHHNESLYNEYEMTDIPYSIWADFNGVHGYPKTITISTRTDEYQEGIFVISYEITYIISDFQVIK